MKPLILTLLFTIACMNPAYAETGRASFYSEGQALASGGRFNPNGISCAHKTLPFGTIVRVTNGNNGKSVDCRVNDRGPYIAGRIIDLSLGAAREVGMVASGVVPVVVDVLTLGAGRVGKPVYQKKIGHAKKHTTYKARKEHYITPSYEYCLIGCL